MVRRAVVGAGAPADAIADDTVKDLVADAVADVILYTGSAFGKQLVVTDRDSNNAPDEYATSDELTLPEQRVIAHQAALNYFFFEFNDKKISETIQDEATSWEYTLSAQVMRDQLKLLQAERDKALEALAAGEVPDSYVSFIAARDYQTSRLIEPWVDAQPDLVALSVTTGQEDYRFDNYG